MRTTRMLALGASVTAGAAALATPALAQYIHIGTVEINRRGDHETQWNRFGGPMEGLRLTARTSNIHCRSIRVQYGNGHWDRVYKGKLHRGRPISVDLRGHRRKLRQIRFVCGTRHHRSGRIAISADVGRYAAEWRRQPQWARLFSLFLGGSVIQGNRDYQHRGYGHRDPWQRVGYKRFRGRRDHERVRLHRDGRDIHKIALRPHYDDARCRHVKATFRNGHTQRLDIGRHDRMREGRLYPLDLRGSTRNVRRVDMTCHGVRHRPVDIEVLAR